jgi:hypothetical protein
MSKTLESSVGQGAANRAADVRLVQAMLSRVPAERGGVRRELVQDGIVGPLTLAAIRGFQRHSVGAGASDGRIDAGDATWRALAQLVDPDSLELAPAGSGRLHLPEPWPVGTTRPSSTLEAWTGLLSSPEVR